VERIGWGGLLLSVCAILRLLGPTGEALEAALIAAGLIAWTMCMGRPAPASWPALLVGFGALMRFDSAPARLAALAATVLLMRSPGRIAGAGFTGAVAAVVGVADLVPGAWSIPVELSRLAGAAIGLLIGESIDAGPSATGGWLLLVWLAAWCALGFTGGTLSWRALAGACAVTGLNVATLPLQGKLAAWIHVLLLAHHDVAPTPSAGVRGVFMRAPLLLPALVALLPAGPRPSGRSLPAAGLVARAAVPAALALLLVAGFVLTGRPGERTDGDIVIRRSDAFDTDIPLPDRHGTSRAGMFGMLPRYLRHDGRQVRFVSPPVSPDVLADASVLIGILPTAPMPIGERRAITQFVEQGGTLLMLADHTDLGGSMGPTNDLTRRRGIEVLFDSAFASRSGWRRCHTGAGRLEPGIGTGASLAIRGSAMPILRAPYAFSDRGDRANSGPGAFFGNKAFDAGERVGDLVLAAGVRVGSGRVVVLGDTSGFQNLVLPWSYPWVVSLLDEASRTPSRARGPAAAVAALASVTLAVLSLSGSTPASVAAVVAILISFSPLNSFRRPSPIERLADSVEPARVALIDAAHMNRYSAALWNERSIGGLMVNLQRSGYTPVVVPDGVPRSVPPGSLVVVIAPRVPLSRAEASRLHAHLDAGGTILVAADGRDRAPLDPLLALWGIRIEGPPLGPVPLRPAMDSEQLSRARQQPQFRDAWSIVSPEDATPRYRGFDRNIVVELAAGTQGSGRLIVIADPDFLTDRVLENEQTAWEGNVVFLRDLLAPGRT